MPNKGQSAKKEDLIKWVERAFDVHTVSEIIHIAPFAEMLKKDPDRAIDKIFQKYDEALDQAYTNENGVNERAFVESSAGGPCELIPWALYKAVGSVYPFLERVQKDRALSQILNILDGRKYTEVNGLESMGHTTGIREPLLLSDIRIVRQLYWPGLYDEEHLWKNHTCFTDLQREIINEKGLFDQSKVKSDFLVGYALLRSDLCSFGEDYVKIAHPYFLERTLKGIVAMRFAHAEDEEQIAQGRKRLEQLLPKSTHNRIEPLRKEADWVDYKKFP